MLPLSAAFLRMAKIDNSYLFVYMKSLAISGVSVASHASPDEGYRVTPEDEAWIKRTLASAPKISEAERATVIAVLQANYDLVA
jgi:hypothetical protein